MPTLTGVRAVLPFYAAAGYVATGEVTVDAGGLAVRFRPMVKTSVTL